MQLQKIFDSLLDKFRKNPQTNFDETSDAEEKKASSETPKDDKCGDFVKFGFVLREPDSPYEFFLMWELPDDMDEESAGDYVALFIDQVLSDPGVVKTTIYNTLKHKAQSENDVTADRAADGLMALMIKEREYKDNNSGGDLVIKPSDVFKNFMSGGIKIG